MTREYSDRQKNMQTGTQIEITLLIKEGAGRRPALPNTREALIPAFEINKEFDDLSGQVLNLKKVIGFKA